MAKAAKGRFAAEIDGDFVVFLIGMRFNQLWALHKWLPVVRAMPRMLQELYRQPELGMLHARSFFSGRTVLVLQYWRSFDQLHAYAHARDKAHLPAWPSLTAGLAITAPSASFMRPTWSRRAAMSAFTRICRLSA